MRQESVKEFAAAIRDRKGPLNILVNNAGLGYIKKSFTGEGVGMLTQVGGWEGAVGGGGGQRWEGGGAGRGGGGHSVVCTHKRR
jgi:NAD(P)-dependent dehydrogenase (short-subunit alcohol dehydrogenase family)